MTETSRTLRERRNGRPELYNAGIEAPKLLPKRQQRYRFGDSGDDSLGDGLVRC